MPFFYLVLLVIKLIINIKIIAKIRGEKTAIHPLFLMPVIFKIPNIIVNKMPILIINFKIDFIVYW
jgi:hypothetical protein